MHVYSIFVAPRPVSTYYVFGIVIGSPFSMPLDDPSSAVPVLASGKAVYKPIYNHDTGFKDRPDARMLMLLVLLSSSLLLLLVQFFY